MKLVRSSRTVLIALATTWALIGCQNDPLYDEVDVLTAPLPKGMGGTPGDSDFCTNPAEPCISGEGDCDSDSECAAGLTCVPNIGAQFGYPPQFDVCVAATCENGVWDADECGIDCGGTSSCGTCSNVILSKGCGGTNGGADYCRNPNNPCLSGEGDCDNDSQCSAGLSCSVNAGPSFGLPAGTDVCVGSTCDNNTWDADECGIDCGGTSSCGTCSPLKLSKNCGGANGDVDFCINPNFLCGVGEGDCDSDAQCAGALVCKVNGGPDYGLPAGRDVCTTVTCDNNVQDADESGVDCGGTSQCGPCSGNGAAAWTVTAGDSANQFGRNVATDSSGNVYAIGYFAGVVNFGTGNLTSAGGNDVFVASFDSSGTVRWANRYGDNKAQLGLGIAVDNNDDVVITGYYQGTINFGTGDLTTTGLQDIFLAKLDSDGNGVWAMSYGESTNNQQGWAVATDPSNNIYLTGHYRGDVNFGGSTLATASDFNIFLASFTSTATHRWSAGYGTSADQALARSVAVNSAGTTVAIAGPFDGSVNFGGSNLSSAGLRDAYLATFAASSGAHSFSARYGDTADQLGRQVTFDSGGNLYLVGYSQGTIDLGCGGETSAGGFDIFLARLNSSGTCLASDIYGDGSDQFVDAVVVDSDDRVIIGGQYEGVVNFGPGNLTASGRDPYIAKFDSSLNNVWQRRFRASGDQRLERLAVSNDIIFGIGVFANRIDTGTGSISSAGGNDIWLSRFEP